MTCFLTLKRMFKTLQLLIGIFFSIVIFRANCYAQTDSVFWYVAPNVSSVEGDVPVYLHFLTFDAPATITVSQPANAGFTPITLSLGANSTGQVDLSAYLADIEPTAANVVNANGLKITSTANINAYYEVQSASNKLAFSLKGRKALGTDFVTPFQKDWKNAATSSLNFSSINIVATTDNTTILITPRTDVVGHLANSTYSVTLNKGETYSVRDMDTTAVTSLAGSIISSNQPIAITLFDGALKTSGCTSSIGDQITSTNYIGQDYIIQKGTGNNDRIYLMATQNMTSFEIHGLSTSSGMLSWGETHALLLTDSITYIHASKPVYLWHVSGYGCELNAAQVAPVKCAGSYKVPFTRTTADSLGLMLFVRSGYEGNFLLNGNPSLVPASAFADVPGTSGEYKAATIYLSTSDVPMNSYNVIENTGDIFGMSTISGGNSTGSEYAYFSEFESSPFVGAGNSDTTCANVAFALNGIVGGGSVTGNWTTNGFGTFDDPSTSLVNTYHPSSLDSILGTIQFVLTSTGDCPIMKDTLSLVVNPAPIVNAGADQSVCSNNATIQLEGSVQGGASTGVWETLGSGTFSTPSTNLTANYFPSQNDIDSGSVQLVLHSTNPGTCLNATDTMVVSFTGSPNVDAGADTLMVCSNNSLVSLNGSVSGPTSSGRWTTGGNGLFLPYNTALNASYQSSLNDTANGSVWLYLSSTANGNCLQEADSVLVIYTPSPVVDAGANIIACTNDSEIQLSGNVGGPTTTGIWSGGNGNFSPSDSSLNAQYTPTQAEITSGSIILTLTSTNNGTCNSTASDVIVNFVAPPLANFNFTSECVNQTTVFTDYSLPGSGNITSWNWDLGQGTTAQTQNGSITYSNSGNYVVELIVGTDFGCYDTVQKTVEAYALPTADFDYQPSCKNNSIVIDFTDQSTSQGGAINSWYYDFGGQGTNASANPSQQFVAFGDFTITHIVKTTNGCVDTIQKVINIPPMPSAGFYFNSDAGLSIGAVFNFIDTSSNAVNFSWNLGDGNTSNIQDPSNIYLNNGTYTVTQYVYGSMGCVDSASQVIVINTVTKEISNLIPNAFSPNGDGANDVWKLKFINMMYPKATVEVFNQWSQEIFSSVGYAIPWDGTYKGESVPDGTYYYVINLNDGSKNSMFKGTVLVLKNGN